MTDRVPGEDERRLRQALEGLSARAPRAYEPPPTMLHRARRRVAATALGAVLVLSAATVGGVALTRAVAERPRPPVPIGPQNPTPTQGPATRCTFAPRELPELPPRLRRVVEENGTFQLADADGTSPEDVWLGGTIHGDFSKPAVTIGVFLHWDGSSMTVLPPEDHMQAGVIDALAPDDVWATTGSGPVHWDGTSWSSDGNPVPAAGALDVALSASGPNDVWAVGGTATANEPFVEHYDGTSWTEVATPAGLHQPRGGPLFISLNDVVALAPDDVWAVGGYFFQGQGTERPEPPVVLHWDGSQWTVVDMPPPGDVAYEADAVAAGGPHDVWVAADAIFPDFETTPGLVLHWDGSSWSQATLASPPGTVLHIESVEVGGPNDVWAAGSAFDPASERSIPVIEHFDGAAWTMVPLSGGKPDAQGRVRSIRIIGDEVWVVGFTALHDPPFVSVCR
jgi:hypothetical protein